MSRADRLLRQVASAVADGEAVDWGDVERRLAQLPEAKQAAGLRLIQELAADRRVSSASGAGAGANREARARGGSTIALRRMIIYARLRVVFDILDFAATFSVYRLSESAADWTLLLPPLLFVLVYRGAGLALTHAAGKEARALSLAGFFLVMAPPVLGHIQLQGISHPFAVARILNLFPLVVFLPFLLWTFTREFPRVLRSDRWAPLVKAAARTCGALGLVLFLVNAFTEFKRPSFWLRFAISPIVFLLCLPIPFVVWRRSRQAGDDERKRAHWFVLGLAFWLMPLGARWLSTSMEASSWLTGPEEYLQLLMVPLMTYAVIARRLPDLRLILRHAIRLTLRQVEEVLVGQRNDPAPALASFSRDAQNARTIGELERLVQERLDELVSPRSAVLLLRDPARSSYAAITSVQRPLAASSSLVRLAKEVSPQPVVLSVEDRGDLLKMLTAEDRSWIIEADPELIVPLTSSRGQTVALFVLGPKRSGLPYTRDDQQAVTALTAAASLALENVAGLGDRARGLGAAEEPAGECRRCGHVAERAQGLCACGRPLAPAAIPFELAGKFRLDKVLGEGGMGVVYRATDLALGRQVALKTLPRLGSEALQRLRLEARSMAGFLHPNLALIFGAETWRGVPILVVEYLAGGSLASRLGEPMAPQEVLRLGMDLAGALEAMHDKGLLHRDVKPSNIGFTGGGVPKLLDFGLARLHDEAHFEVPVRDPGLSSIADEKLRLTLTGQVVGTPLYMAPEALTGASPCPGHDLWSLHLVLWEALAGRHPFAGLSLEEAVQRMAREKVPDIRAVRPDCPAEIARLLVRALRPNAHDRPATAGAVRQAFLGAGWTA